MSPHQVLDLPSMFVVGIIGFILGGLVNYFSNLFLYKEGLISDCQKRVKWQYLLAEVSLAIAFIMLVHSFGLHFYTFGLMAFVIVLLAICITDFRTKIIPHEITYPAILAGIIFSIIIKADVLGALAGIGISYILFDFLAFYGLQVYIWFNKPTLASGQQFISIDKQTSSLPSKSAGHASSWLSKESQPAYVSGGKKQTMMPQLYCKGIPIEELEVIGGGDAVLSALIAAWLGWQKLIAALLMGFFIGTIIGAIYVLIELAKERLLRSIISPVISCVLGLSLLAISMLWMLAKSMNQSLLNMPYLHVLPLAVLSGCVLGIIIAGSKISKPFPFGPALAIGAFIAIFRSDIQKTN